MDDGQRTTEACHNATNQLLRETGTNVALSSCDGSRTTPWLYSSVLMLFARSVKKALRVV